MTPPDKLAAVLDEITSKAKAATQSKWGLAELCSQGGFDQGRVLIINGRERTWTKEPDEYADIAHIARMDPPTTLALVAIARAAADMLNFGAHDGPCDNADDDEYSRGSCTFHIAATMRRNAALATTLAALTTEPRA